MESSKEQEGEDNKGKWNWKRWRNTATEKIVQGTKQYDLPNKYY
jgi:hypothetical protein